MEDPTEPLVFDAPSEDTCGDWLQENYYARELDGKRVNASTRRTAFRLKPST
jgi:hypothetical protein